MYLELNRFIKYLKPYSIIENIPDVSSLSAANELILKVYPPTDEDKFDCKTADRLIKVRTGQQNLFIFQHTNNEGHSTWQNYGIWDVPDDFNWSILLPDFSLPEYIPQSDKFVIYLDEEITLHIGINFAVRGKISYESSLKIKDTEFTKPTIEVSSWPTSQTAKLKGIRIHNKYHSSIEQLIDPDSPSDLTYLLLSTQAYEQIEENLRATLERLHKEVLAAINQRQPLSSYCYPILSSMYYETKISEPSQSYRLSPLTIAEEYRKKTLV